MHASEPPASTGVATLPAPVLEVVKRCSMITDEDVRRSIDLVSRARKGFWNDPHRDMSELYSPQYEANVHTNHAHVHAELFDDMIVIRSGTATNLARLTGAGRYVQVYANTAPVLRSKSFGHTCRELMEMFGESMTSAEDLFPLDDSPQDGWVLYPSSNPGEALVHFDLGHAYLEMELFYDALEELRLAHRLQPAAPFAEQARHFAEHCERELGYREWGVNPPQC